MVPVISESSIMYVCVCVYVYVCMCVCVCVYVYVYLVCVHRIFKPAIICRTSTPNNLYYNTVY